MSKELIKRVVADFANSGKESQKEAFKVTSKPDYVYVVTIERRDRRMISESLALESLSNTISAFPSGSKCECCKGSGRSS